MPDPQMIRQYLSSRGAELNDGNIGKATKFFGSNPDLLDRRAMGLPGGLDDNSSVLDAMLDKHIADTAPAGQVEVLPPTKAETQGNARPAPAPSRTAPTVKGPTEVGGTTWQNASENPNLGPLPARDASAGERAATPTTDYSPSTDSPNVDIGGIGEWLKSLLGISATGALAGAGARAAKQGDPQLPNPNNPKQLTYQPKLEDKTTRGNFEATGDEMNVVNARNAASRTGRENQIRAEVADENDAMTRAMEDAARKRKAQQAAEETARAARRATGRK
jgi:hypothetical protein